MSLICCLLNKCQICSSFYRFCLFSCRYYFSRQPRRCLRSVRDWVLKKEEKGLIKNYWRYYKENYKKSLLSGVIFTIVWLILGVDLYYFSEENTLLLFVFRIFGIILFVYTINFFSVSAHYQMPLRKLFRNTFTFTFGSPVLFIAVLISSVLILYISFSEFTFLIPFFTGSSIAFLSFAAFYQLFLKLTKQNEE